MHYFKNHSAHLPLLKFKMSLHSTIYCCPKNKKHSSGHLAAIA
ncbi:hypothetical protein DLM_4201 [Aquitalea magnusonii]|uniref:Uncharacterized protein n=1 Tax=Aquitalea magnusonii TaxID=332411 RepID=A0A3G9GK92_9NEIS|nr:hypothetical protein DLM_4201 [Aquitalea magnusonii]